MGPLAPDIQPVCPYFYLCGGCDYQDVSYARQVEGKDAFLRQLFATLPGSGAAWRPFLASQEEYPLYYRNKLRFGFLEREGRVWPSRHRKGDEEADIAVEECFLLSPESNQVVLFLADFASRHGWKPYQPVNGQGWLKHVLIRQGKQTGEMLVSLVTTDLRLPDAPALLSELPARFPFLRSLYQSRTSGRDNLHLTDFHLWGEEAIHERVGEYLFRISPHAFFQTNSLMLEPLYRAVGEMTALGGRETLWDLYAGSATIGIFLSGQAGRVVSLESSPASQPDAAWNLEHNKIGNLSYHNVATEQLCQGEFLRSLPPPDAIVVDPPRAGLSERVRRLLPHLPARRLVYVSCNPATCLRDCRELLAQGYRLSGLRGVDMFPHTAHCELIACLEKDS